MVVTPREGDAANWHAVVHRTAPQGVVWAGCRRAEVGVGKLLVS